MNIDERWTKTAQEVLLKASPAFPISLRNKDSIVTAHGLSKREYFAGLAMQALISNPTLYNPEHTADRAVRYADALLAELEKKP